MYLVNLSSTSWSFNFCIYTFVYHVTNNLYCKILKLESTVYFLFLKIMLQTTLIQIFCVLTCGSKWVANTQRSSPAVKFAQVRRSHFLFQPHVCLSKKVWVHCFQICQYLTLWKMIGYVKKYHYFIVHYFTLCTHVNL